jgi:hypothetical protein
VNYLKEYFMKTYTIYFGRELHQYSFFKKKKNDTINSFKLDRLNLNYIGTNIQFQTYTALRASGLRWWYLSP